MSEPCGQSSEKFCQICGCLIDADHPTEECPHEKDRVKIVDADVRASFDIDRIAALQAKIDWHEKVAAGVMDFHEDQIRRLQNQIKFWSTCLENYLRSTDNKTMKFSSGEIKLRTVGGNVVIPEDVKPEDRPDWITYGWVTVKKTYSFDKKLLKKALEGAEGAPEGITLAPKEQRFSYKLYNPKA